MIVSVLWPAWVWAKKPQWRALFASYALPLVTRDAVKCRELMKGEWYTQWFRDPATSPLIRQYWGFQDAQDLKTFYQNTRGGFRVSVSVGNGTGYRGDCLVIDDPLRADEAHSKLAREGVLRWKTETMSSRFNDMASAQEVCIMQRLHEEDLSGYLLKQGGWQHLSLPSEFEPSNRSTTHDVIGNEFWHDPRKEEGELLFPQKFSKQVLEDAKSGRGMGSYAYAGQHQQRPVPASGGMLQRAWFSRRWLLPDETAPAGFETRTLPFKMDQYGIFCDAAFKKTEDSDFVAIGVFGTKGPDVYLLELVWRRMGFSETVSALSDLRQKWGHVSGIFIEDKANGSAIIEVLKGKLPGIIAVDPGGGKEARIAAVSPFIEAGNLWLPYAAHWVNDYIAEASAFPKAPHDDAIDMTAYALRQYCGKSTLSFIDAITKW